MSGSRRLFAGLTILAGLAFSGAASAENVLRWASAGSAGTFDPHSFDEIPTWNQQLLVYERLLDVGPDLEIVPQLAVDWKLIDPLTWEFSLRQGVWFHDGTPFTAEDDRPAIELDRAREHTVQANMSHTTEDARATVGNSIAGSFGAGNVQVF